MISLVSQNKLLNILATVSLCLLLSTTLGCKKKDLQTLGALIAIGIAAKVIYDMTIEHETQQVTNEKEVNDKYKEEHKAQSNLRVSYLHNGEQITLLRGVAQRRGGLLGSEH